MQRQLGQQIRRGFLALACGWAPMSGGLALAQGDTPVKPANVTAPPRYYVVESIVVAVLFAGAIFSVCRNSGRN